MIKRYFYPPLKIIKYLFLNSKKRVKLKNDIKLNYDEKLIVTELKKKGYFVFKNYLSKEKCRDIINQIDNTIKHQSKKIWRDKNNSDNRIFFAEKLNNNILNYYKNNFIQKIGESYCGFKLKNVMTMANKVVFSKKNEGSGAGWHKDSYGKQFKSIIYLNDVENNNGPFQLVKNSNNLFNVLKTSIFLNKSYPNTRFENVEIQKIFNSKNLETLIGKAGTLIFFDPSLIHRGAPLISSQRYAITNYYDSIHNYENYINKISHEHKF